MRYFRDNNTEEVFGFDETDETQLPYMQVKIDAGLEEITGSWPPAYDTPVADKVIQTQPTKEELLAKLLEIQAQLEAMK